MSNTEKTGGRDANYWRRRMGLPVEEGNVGAGTSAPAPEPAPAPAPEPEPTTYTLQGCRPGVESLGLLPEGLLSYPEKLAGTP